MKVCVTLETGDGERIVEIDREEILHGMLELSSLETAVPAFENILHAMVVSPARGMFRGKVHQLQDKQGFVRIIRPGESAASRPPFSNTEDESVYMDNVRRLAAQRTTAARSIGDDHGATCLVSGCAKE